jgi:glyoxalase family protein
MSTTHLSGHHHITLSVAGAQEDHDFHVKLLGMSSVKKTVLFDGTTPIYHLYYGNRNGDTSTIITTFPFAKAGVFGRRGSGQVKIVQCSVPQGALAFWEDRLGRAGRTASRSHRLGHDRLGFDHPCGIAYELVAVADDRRPPILADGIGADVALRGTYGAAVSVQSRTGMDDFLQIGLGFRKLGDDGAWSRYDVAGGGAGRVVELVEEPDAAQGSWTFGAGTVHHVALETTDADSQKRVKDHLEGMGFTDVSESKNRKYFFSVYVRSPGGALFEVAYTAPQGWTIDEPADALGHSLQFPEWFEDRRDEMVAKLEPFDY